MTVLELYRPLNFLARRPERTPLDRPLPVTLVITDLDVGGAERALVSLAIGLDRSRWTPSVVTLGPEGVLAEHLRNAGIETICLDVDRRRPIQAVLRLRRVIRSLQPVLVQGFLFHANIASRIAARLAGARFVLGGLRVAERGVGWHLRLDRWSSWLSDGSVCVSEGVRRHAIERRVQKKGRLHTIPNGIDPGPIDRAPRLVRSEIGVEENAHLALFVGRIDRQKGVSDLLEAAREVASQRPEWRLVIVGDGPLRPELETASQIVRWLGRREDVPSILKAADVLVLPSLWEGMPNVILEAMAASLPVVATRVEGSEDLVIPGVTGWLVPPGDPTALATALRDAASDEGRLRAFAVSGRARIEAEFSQSAVVAAYDRLWSRVIGLPPDGL